MAHPCRPVPGSPQEREEPFAAASCARCRPGLPDVAVRLPAGRVAPVLLNPGTGPGR